MVKFSFRCTPDSPSYCQASIVMKQFRFMVCGCILGFTIFTGFIILPYSMILRWRFWILNVIANLGRRFCNFLKSPMVLLIFDVSIFRCFQNVNCLSIIIPRKFWDDDSGYYMLLKNNSGWLIFFDFWLKMTSWACLVGVGLKFMFYWKAQLLILAKTLFSSFADVFMPCVTVNK